MLDPLLYWEQLLMVASAVPTTESQVYSLVEKLASLQPATVQASPTNGELKENPVGGTLP